MSKGIFLTFEGGDGAGKTTHIKRLAEKLENMGREVLIIREPGGTKIGEKIREILLDNNNKEMCSITELLLYEAARAQIVKEKIKPALESGKVVLCDRFFDSTVAYQGYARGIDIQKIKDTNLFATEGLSPDRTILIITDDVEKSIARATKDDGADRIEAEGADFQQKVYDGFLKLAKQEKDRIKVVKLQPTKDETFTLIYKAIKNLFL